MNDAHELLNNFIQKYLRVPKNDDSWSLVLKKHKFFLFSNEFDESTWNLFANRHELPNVSAVVHDNQVSLAYKDKKIVFTLHENREDGILFVFNVAALVADDFKIFYCKDSWHSDDLAFIVIPSELWRELNTPQNAELINQRLLGLDFDSFQEFMNHAFSGTNKNEYLSNNLSVLISGSDLPTPEEWIEMFAKNKINVAWRRYARDVSNVDSVPIQNYRGWYLQEMHRICKTVGGLEFKEVLIFSDCIRLSFEKMEFNKKAWICLMKILVRYNKVLIQSGEKFFSQKAFGEIYS